ncbi:cytochrome P450 family protein [Xanthomonas sp. GW]|uniref:hypothetical protein n=1 Tax=Xanthomonas sp. GW TaxID=2724121 RepID=UPI00210227C4|nr:hypothetical protein [Xanthomonas sp. GW]
MQASSSSPHVPPFPQLPATQVVRGLRRGGYAFVSEQCERLHSDVFQTRMLLRTATFARGADAVAAFYHPGRFTRRGALPPTTVALLQGFGSVQRLDGDAHLQRKRLFRAVLAPDASAALVDEFRRQWRERARNGRACRNWSCSRKPNWCCAARCAAGQAFRSMRRRASVAQANSRR